MSRLAWGASARPRRRLGSRPRRAARSSSGGLSAQQGPMLSLRFATQLKQGPGRGAPARRGDVRPWACGHTQEREVGAHARAGRSARFRAVRPPSHYRVRGPRRARVLPPADGGVLDDRRYAITLRLALASAGITDYVRPFHDGRHTSITNAAAAGMSAPALMARAGHSDFKTTQGYIDLTGETFREEADLLDARLFGQKS